MSQTMPTAFLPSTMEKKLAQISRRQATISVLRAIAIGASVLLATMIIAMLIDWQLTLFNTTIRIALTVTSLLLTIGAVLITGVPTLVVALRRVEAAIGADAEIPQLEERWQTVANMAKPGRPPPMQRPSGTRRRSPAAKACCTPKTLRRSGLRAPLSSLLLSRAEHRRS